MIDDILSVMFKERKGLLRPRGGWGAVARMFLPPVALTILLPLQIGEGFLDMPFVLIMTFIIPMAIILVTIPDSFAGERERHTLETLLASRLTDRAILFGKLIVPVVFTWVILAVSHTMALVLFNVIHWDGGVRIHPPTLLLGMFGLGLLLPFIGGAMGILVSLRASTVQGAAQALIFILFSPLIALQIGGAIVLSVGQDKIQTIIDALDTANWVVILPLILLGLLLLAAMLLAAAMARFQRARLILN